MTFDSAALLQGAVAIESVSGHEAELAEFLVEQVSGFTDRAYRDEVGNVVATTGNGSLKVLFVGHIDTVPGLIPVRLENGRLYGRGSVDAKGALCAALSVAATLPDAARANLSLGVIGAVEEELPSSKGARHLLATWTQPDFVIVGEPSGWDSITLGYKGRLLATLAVELDGRHSAVDAPTAAAEVVAVWNDVSRWVVEINAGREGLFDRIQVSLQEIESGGDGLKQSARASIGFRLPQWLEPETVVAFLQRAVADGPPVTVEPSGAESAYRGPRDTPLTRAFRVAIRRQGGQPRTKVKTGTSDMNIIGSRWTMPMVAYGPGDSSLDHTPKEHLKMAEYQQAVRVLAEALVQLADRQEPVKDRRSGPSLD